MVIKYFIKQRNKCDCVFICLKVLLANIFKKKNFLYLLDKKEDRYSLFEIIEKAKEYNLILKGYRASNKNDIFEFKKIPFIAVLNNDNASNHAVLVYKINKNNVYYFDPSIGKIKLDKKEFLLKFSGEFLLYKEHKKTKLKPPSYNFVSVYKKILLLFIEAISSLCMLSALFFIKEDTPFYVPLILIASYFILEIILKTLMSSIYKEIDSKILKLIKLKKNRVKNFSLSDLLYFKKNIMTNAMTLLSTIIIISIYSGLLIFNLKLNIYFILFVFILSLVSSLIYKVYETKLINNINSNEDYLTTLNEYNNNAKFLHIIEALFSSSNKLFSFYQLKSSMIYFFLFLASLLLSALSKNASLNFLLFHFFSFSFLFNEFEKIFYIYKKGNEILNINNKVISYLYNK